MRREVLEMLSTMTVYEKYELSAKLMHQQQNIYSELENVRHRTDQYCQGMLMAKVSHGLNDLVVKQLETVKALTDDAKYR